MKVFKIIIILVLVAAVGVGVYFRSDVVKFYNGVGKQVKNFSIAGGPASGWQKNIEQTISQVEKQVLAPLPLNMGGTNNQVVLLQSKIISETNLQRQENGNLPALTENLKLDQTASAKASDLFLKQYFEHVSPSGVGPGDLAQKYGYNYIVEGENLILGNFSSEKEVLQDWMNSPEHRANILNNRYTEMGAAIVKGTYKGQTVWIGVQEFGLPLSTCSAPNAAFKNQIDSEQTQLDELASQINAKKTEIDSTNSGSPAYSQMVDDYNQMVSQYNSLASQIKGNVAIYNSQVNIFNNCVKGK